MKLLRLSTVILLATVGVAASSTAAWSQVSTYRLEIRKAEVVDNDYNVFFSLLGSSQQAIKKIDPATIKVTDADNPETVLNSGETQIKLLADRSDRRVAVMFVVANTRAFNNKTTNSRTAIKEFVQRMRTNGDIVGMVTYGTAYRDIPFSPDISAVASQIEGIKDGDDGDPRIFTALGRGVQRFALDLDQQQIDLRYMVIISDGAGAWVGRKDRSFVDTKTTRLARKFKEMEVTPIIVGYGALGDADEPGLQFLGQLASQAGGTYREAKDPEEVLNQTDAAFNEIYGSHVMTFHSNALAGGAQHKIRIEAAVDAQKLKSPPYQLYVPESDSKWILWALIGGGVLAALFLLGAVVFAVVLFIRRRNASDEEMYYEPAPPVMASDPGVGQVAPAMVEDSYKDEPPAQYFARLNARSGPLHGRNYYLTEKVVTMGSADSNQIQLGDSTISKKHAGIRIKNERFEVHDFGSTNGVFINGRRVSQQYLKNGDIIKMGDTELEFNLK